MQINRTPHRWLPKSFVDPAKPFPWKTGPHGHSWARTAAASQTCSKRCAGPWVQARQGDGATARWNDLIFHRGRPAAAPRRETAEVTLCWTIPQRTAPHRIQLRPITAGNRCAKLRRRRRGTSYKLNGRTVRGKDIQLLFVTRIDRRNFPSPRAPGPVSELDFGSSRRTAGRIR